MIGWYIGWFVSSILLWLIWAALSASVPSTVQTTNGDAFQAAVWSFAICGVIVAILYFVFN